MVEQTPSNGNGDIEAALDRAGRTAEIDDFGGLLSSLRLAGENFREIVVSRPAAGPAPVAVSDQRVLVDARKSHGEVHVLPVHAVTSISATRLDDGSVDVVLDCLGAPVVFVGLTEIAARRMRWAIEGEEVIVGRPKLGVDSLFNSWIDVHNDAELSDSDRQDEIDRILAL